MCGDDACGRFLLKDMNEMNLCIEHMVELDHDNEILGREY